MEHVPLLSVQPCRAWTRRRRGVAQAVADSIEALGDVDVHDVVFHSHVTDGEDDLTMTVYYDEQPRRR